MGKHTLMILCCCLIIRSEIRQFSKQRMQSLEICQIFLGFFSPGTSRFLKLESQVPRKLLTLGVWSMHSKQHQQDLGAA